jgi:hypothetical protein
LDPKDQGDQRALTLGELYSKTFQVARKNYLHLLPIFAAFGILVALLFTGISAATPMPNIPANFSPSSTDLTSAMDSVFRYIEYTLGNYFVTWSILYFAAGLGIWRIYEAREKTGTDDDSGPKLIIANLAITTVITVIIIELGIFLIFVGALFFATMFYLVNAVSVLEGKGPLDALGRSRKLVSGNWGKTFLLLIGIQIIIYIVSALISGVVALLPLDSNTSMLATNFVQELVLALEFPIVSASMLVLYNSNKGSKEIELRRPPSPYDSMRPQPMDNFGAAGKSCSACGASLSPDEKFCHNCGAPQGGFVTRISQSYKW